MEKKRQFVVRNGTSEFRIDHSAIPAIQGGLTMKDLILNCENVIDRRMGPRSQSMDPKKKDEQK